MTIIWIAALLLDHLYNWLGLQVATQQKKQKKIRTGTVKSSSNRFLELTFSKMFPWCAISQHCIFLYLYASQLQEYTCGFFAAETQAKQHSHVIILLAASERRTPRGLLQKHSSGNGSVPGTAERVQVVVVVVIWFILKYT